MSTRLLKILLAFIVTVSLFYAYYIGFNNVKVHDDYIFKGALQKMSVWEFSWKMYLTDDGRFFTPLSFFRLSLFKYLPHNIVIVVWVALLHISSYLVVLILRKVHFKGMSLSSLDKYLLSGVVFFLVWLGIKDHISYTLYKMIMGSYIPCLALILLWYLHYLKKERNNYFFYPLSVVVAMCSQHFVLPIITLFIIHEIVQWKQKEVASKQQSILLFAIFILGQSFITFSPGSFHRYGVNKGGSYVKAVEDPTFKELLINHVNVQINSLQSSLPIIILSIVLGGLLIWYLNANNGRKIIDYLKIERLPLAVLFKKGFELKLLFHFRFFLAAMSSVFVFFPMLLFAPRYNFLYQVMVFLLLANFLCMLFARWTEKGEIVSLERSKKYILFIFVILFIPIGTLLKKQAGYSSEGKAFLDKREQFLEENRGAKKVKIPAIESSSMPFTLKFADIHEMHAAMSINLEEFYGIDSVLISKKVHFQDLKTIQANDYQLIK